MELRREQFERIKDYLPRQRGKSARGDNFALLCAREQGCKWRSMAWNFTPV